jgi:hypothetical protein
VGGKGGDGGRGELMTQALYAHMNNKTIKKRVKNKNKNKIVLLHPAHWLRWGLLSFLPRLPPPAVFLVSASRVAGIMAVYNPAQLSNLKKKKKEKKEIASHELCPGWPGT